MVQPMFGASQVPRGLFDVRHRQLGVHASALDKWMVLPGVSRIVEMVDELEGIQVQVRK